MHNVVRSKKENWIGGIKESLPRQSFSCSVSCPPGYWALEIGVLSADRRPSPENRPISADADWAQTIDIIQNIDILDVQNERSIIEMNSKICWRRFGNLKVERVLVRQLHGTVSLFVGGWAGFQPVKNWLFIHRHNELGDSVMQCKEQIFEEENNYARKRTTRSTHLIKAWIT